MCKLEKLLDELERNEITMSYNEKTGVEQVQWNGETYYDELDRPLTIQFNKYWEKITNLFPDKGDLLFYLRNLKEKDIDTFNNLINRINNLPLHNVDERLTEIENIKDDLLDPHHHTYRTWQHLKNDVYLLIMHTIQATHSHYLKKYISQLLQTNLI